MNTNLHTRVSVLMLWKENIFSLYPMKIIRNLSFVPEKRKIRENIDRDESLWRLVRRWKLKISILYYKIKMENSCIQEMTL